MRLAGDARVGYARFPSGAMAHCHRFWHVQAVLRELQVEAQVAVGPKFAAANGGIGRCVGSDRVMEHFTRSQVRATALRVAPFTPLDGPHAG